MTTPQDNTVTTNFDMGRELGPEGPAGFQLLKSVYQAP